MSNKKKGKKDQAKTAPAEPESKATPEQERKATAEWLKDEIVKAVTGFNADNDLNRNMTLKEYNTSVKEARAALKGREAFKRNGRETRTYTAPTEKVGDNLTVVPIAGKDKGTPLTGIYLEWNGKNGLAKVYMPGRRKNVSGRLVATS